VPGTLCRALRSDARHARQRRLHCAFIGVVRGVVGARQRVAFAVRPIESARQIIWRTAKVVFPVVHTGNLVMFSLNSRLLLLDLLPKTSEVGEMHQYKLICFLNTSFRIFTKISLLPPRQANTSRLAGISQAYSSCPLILSLHVH
jgi:hypothetical protein